MLKRMIATLATISAVTVLLVGQAVAAPPAAPSLTLPPTPDADGYFRLVWSKPVGATGFVLEQSLNGGAFAPVYSGAGTFFTALYLAPGTYTYQVKATNADGDSGYTVGGYGVVVPAVVPALTTLTVPATSSTGRFTVGISPSPISGVTYVLEESLLGDFTDATVAYTGTRTSVTLTRVAGTYSYRAKATKVDYADGAYTPVKAITVSTPKAMAPAGLFVPSLDADGTYNVNIYLSQTPGATYVLEESADGGTNWSQVFSGATRLYGVTGKAAGTQYAYRAKVQAANYTDSDWTAVKSVIIANSADCGSCHDGGIASDIKTAWSASRHANGNSSPGALTYTCSGCHAPNQEVTGTGQMMIGCVACHKLGADGHPTDAFVNAQWVCGKCHDSHKSADDSIASKVAASKHANGRGHNTSAKCERCHTTEGSIQFAAYTGDKVAMTVMDTANGGTTFPQITPDQGPTCAACHDHSGGLRAVAGWDPNGNATADQFDLCTSCHTLFNQSGVLTASGTSGTAPFYHDTAWYRQIATTHYDNPTTGVGLASNVIEGYVVRQNDANPCFDCHGHELRTNTRYAATPDPLLAERKPTTHTDWAQSAHAGGLLKNKLTAIGALTGTAASDAALASGVTDAPVGNAWAHYNWDDNASRGSCQRCHTATGASNFLSNPKGYVAANNTFSHLSGWTAAGGSPQNEVLYCWGCHSNAGTGALRNPGAITEVYAGTPAVTVKYPDLGASNVCMGCHLGREVGQNVAVSTGNFTNLSFINSHYLTAGSTILNESGYEYAGQSYDSLGYHKNVGMNNAFGTGNDGPCVACHMNSSNKHSFSVVTEDAGGVITAITSNTCASCHGGLSAAILETSKEEFHVALGELEAALAAKGIYFYEAHPYFYKDPNGDGFDPATEAISANAFKNWDGVYPGKGKDVMGAAFNYNLLEHDPGAYAHNRQYALKLIADSIDFLADGTVDGLGIPTAVTNVVYGAEFAEATSHPAGIVSAASAVNCGICHAAAPHYGGAVLAQAQYAVSTSANTSSCEDCHAGGNPAPSTINLQFAESGHGDVKGDPWYHYDWRAASRASCARCHNATAYVAKLGNETDTTNIFNAADTNLPNEVLRCNACHTDISTGDVRAPGAYTETYADGTQQAFPDVGKSNLCLRCHSGRESGGSIVASADDDGVLSFINSHYLSAGGTLFTTTGYHYDANGNSLADDYPNPPTYLHDEAGIANPASPLPTDRGPCAECHMGAGTANHTWEPVAKDLDGTITTIVSTGCADCHSGAFAITPTVLNTAKSQYHAALTALDGALQNVGIHFYNAHPYFYTAPYVVGGTNTGYTNWAGPYGLAGWKNTMGAAFNYNLLEHDPGGYVHNSRYTRRLLRDAIDWVDNGALDNSVPATLTSLQTAGKLTVQQLADAQTYLGDVRP